MADQKPNHRHIEQRQPKNPANDQNQKDQNQQTARKQAKEGPKKRAQPPK